MGSPSGVTLYLDADGDAVRDEEEASVTTDGFDRTTLATAETGTFTLRVDPGSGYVSDFAQTLTLDGNDMVDVEVLVFPMTFRSNVELRLKAGRPDVMQIVDGFEPAWEAPTALVPTFIITTGLRAARAACSAAMKPSASRMPSQ